MSTARKKGLNAYEASRLAFQNKPYLPSIISTA
jgi:hypothetical protein